MKSCIRLRNGWKSAATVKVAPAVTMFDPFKIVPANVTIKA